MKILSFETASYFGGVALCVDGDVGTRGPFEPRGASRCILAAADELLQARGLEMRDLDAIAVSTGPGLFTGVRVGLALAKTLAWASGGGAPRLVGVATLEAVALFGTDEKQPPEARQADATADGADATLVVGVTDARRGEVYGGLYAIAADGWPRLLGREIVARPLLLARRLAEEAGGAPAAGSGALVLAGDGAERYRDSLLEAFGEHFPRRSPRVVQVTKRNLAEAVARLARRRLEAGEADDPAALGPDYVRRPDARRPVIETDL